MHSLGGLIHAEHRGPSIDYTMGLRMSVALTNGCCLGLGSVAESRETFHIQVARSIEHFNGRYMPLPCQFMKCQLINGSNKS